MAERRMFAKTIIDSDIFLDMPLSTQALYFHLCMRADDDGFINNPRKIMRMINSTDDDLKVLTTKRFIIPFESGVVVIKHWKIHNYIQADRYKPTVYAEERALLIIKPNKSYTDKGLYPECIHDGNNLYAQSSLGKSSQDKGSRARAREGDDDCFLKIEDAAGHNGLPWYEADRERAGRLSADYSEDWVIKAIERAGLRGKQNWGFVEAILKSWKKKGGMDEPGAKNDAPAVNVPWVISRAK